jgi:thiol-disulfide isomerase/thioredoxin
MTFFQRIQRNIILTVPLAALLVWSAPAQVAEKLTTPEWKEFKASIAEFDVIMLAIQKLQDEHPEAANDPTKMQELLGDKMTRFYELYQSIPQKLPADLKDITDFEDFGIDELRVLKYATNIAQNFSSALDVNLTLVQLVQDPDSIRSISAESAQFAVLADRLELAEGMLKDGVLDSAEHMQRVMLFNSMSTAYAERKDPERAREYTLLAMKASGEALRSARTGLNTDQYPQIEAYLAQQTGSSAAEILYTLKEAGDVHELELYRQLLMKALAEETAWPAFERSMNEQLTKIEKDKGSLNQPAMEWKEHLWIGSKALSVAGLKGKVVLVDFFATWCRPCIMAFPYIKQWQEKYEDKGLVIVGLTSYQGRYEGANQKPEEEFAKLRDDFIPKHKITWPVGVEKSGRQTMLDYQVQGIPHVVLIDRNGKIQYVKVGASDYDKTEKKIQELLAQ